MRFRRPRSRDVMIFIGIQATSQRVYAHRKPPELSRLFRTICRIGSRGRQMPAATVTPGNDGTPTYRAPALHPPLQTATNWSSVKNAAFRLERAEARRSGCRGLGTTKA